MPKVFAFYSLKPGVSKEDFEEWSRDVDQKTMIQQPGVRRFEVYRVNGAIAGDASFDFVEDIDVDDLDEWRSMTEREEVQPLIAPFEEMVQADQMVMVFADKV